LRAIKTEEDYELVEAGVEKILNKTKILPENVFRQAYKYFLFITFDELFMPLFFNHLKEYLLAIGDDHFWLTSIDPEPKSYFGVNFDFYGAIQFSSSDTDDEYITALNNYPADGPADALAHNSNTLVLFSPSYGWAIYGDRNSDIAICAFTDRKQMELFRSIYGSDLLDGVDAAAKYAYGATSKSELRAKFCSSYLAD